MPKALLVLALLAVCVFAKKEPTNVCSAVDKETAEKYKDMGDTYGGAWRALLSAYSSHCYSLLRLRLDEGCVIRKVTGLPFNLSRPCAQCYAAASTCGARHCKLACLGRTLSKGCVACADKWCRPAGEKCSGIPG